MRRRARSFQSGLERFTELRTVEGKASVWGSLSALRFRNVVIPVRN